MKKLMLVATILVAPPAYAHSMPPREPPLPEHICRLHSDGSITCTTTTFSDCQQLTAYVRVNDSIDGLEVLPLSSGCEKIAPPSVGYRISFELL
jgi:hypothetical protein